MPMGCMHRLIKSYKPAAQFLLLPTFQIRQTRAQEAKVVPGVQLRCPFPSHLFASSPKVADGGSQQLRAFVDPSQHRRVFRSCLLFCFERTPAGWSRGDNNCLDFLRSLLGEAAWSQGRKEAAGPLGQGSNPDSVTACVALERCSTALRLWQRESTPPAWERRVRQKFRAEGSAPYECCVHVVAALVWRCWRVLMSPHRRPWLTLSSGFSRHRASGQLSPSACNTLALTSSDGLLRHETSSLTSFNPAAWFGWCLLVWWLNSCWLTWLTDKRGILES